MTKKFKIATLALSACMALGVVGFTACGQAGKSAYDIWLEQGNTGTEQDFLDSLKGAPGKDGVGTNGKSAYEIWKEYHPEENLTETQWLESLKGAAGETPEITISDDGYWEINGEKTSQKAQGNDGDMPEISISDDGYWEINGQKTSQKAQGDPGTPGTPGTPGAAGARGNKITKGEGAPASTEGAVEGDMYVDVKEWHVYFFESGAWKDYGSIKGEGSGSGDEEGGDEDSSQYKLVKDFGQMTIGTAERVPLELNDVNNGTYFLIVESDGEAVANNLTTFFTVDNLGTNNYDMYCPLTKEYKSVVKKEDSMKLSLIATTQSVTGNVKLVEYSAPTLKANETYEIPLVYGAYGRLPLNFDSALIGHKVHFEIKFYKHIMAITIGHFDESQQYKQDVNMVKATGDQEYVATYDLTITSDMSAIIIGTLIPGEHCNGTVKLTIAD